MAPGRDDDDAGHDDAGFDVRQAYRQHGSELFGFAVNATGDRAAAEDCVQETFIRAWRSRSRFRASAGSQRTWLFAIARNVVIDAHRARSRRPVLVDDDHLARVASASEEDARVVERVTLQAALARLSPEHREVVVAVQIEAMTYQELADRTGVAVGTLRSRMFYGLQALRAELGEEGDDDAGHVTR